MKVHKSICLKMQITFSFSKNGACLLQKNKILQKSLKNIKITTNTIVQRVELSNMFFSPNKNTTLIFADICPEAPSLSS